MLTPNKTSEIKRYQQQQQQARKKLQQQEQIKEPGNSNKNSANNAGAGAAGGVHFAVESPKVMSKEFENTKSNASPPPKKTAQLARANSLPSAESLSRNGSVRQQRHDDQGNDNNNKNNNPTGGKNLFNESINVDTFDRDSDDDARRKNRMEESNITAGVLADDDNFRIAGHGGSAHDSSSGGGSDTHSRNSANSASSAGTINRMKQSTIPCGLTNTQLMILLILIPIGFLAGYTLSDVADAVASERMLSNHKDVIQHLLDVGFYLQASRRDASLYLGAAPNSTVANTSLSMFVQNRVDADASFASVIDQMQDSDLFGRESFLSDARDLMKDMERTRYQVIARTVSGNKARNDLLLMIERAYLLNSYISRDPRGAPLESRIIIFTIMRRIQNSVGHLRAHGTGVLAGDSADALANVKDLHAMRSSLERDLMLARLAGRPEVAKDIDSWIRSDLASHFWDLNDQIEFGNATTWSQMNVTDFIFTANSLIAKMNAGDAAVLQIIVNGELLKVVAITAGMKMLGAILCCIAATILVIFYNRREQIRLEKLLEATSALAEAVQRFVPKNQLRTMGIRSITQVTAGQSTLVAQTVLFSDVVGFSGVACVLPPLELFDWLQNYVGRMSAVIAEEKAYISNFLGDGLMIIASQPTNGLNAAIKMHVAVDKLNLELVSQGSKKPIAIGVGLTHDITCCAVFGDENRLTCTTIGHSANTASRLEALTRSFGAKILAAQNVIDQVSPDLFRSRCVGKIRVSGSNGFVVAFDVYSADPLPSQDYKDATKQKFEEAVRLTETEPENAAILFAELMIQAKTLGINDKALESRKKGTDMDIVSAASTPPATPCMTRMNTINTNLLNNSGQPVPLRQSPRSSAYGLLAFEKDGELKPTEDYQQHVLVQRQQQQAIMTSKNLSSHHNSKDLFFSSNVNDETPVTAVGNLVLLPHETGANSDRQQQPQNRFLSIPQPFNINNNNKNNNNENSDRGVETVVDSLRNGISAQEHQNEKGEEFAGYSYRNDTSAPDDDFRAEPK